MMFETFFHMCYFQGHFVIKEIQKSFPFSVLNLTFVECLLVRLASMIVCFTVEVANNTWHSHRKNWQETEYFFIFSSKCLVANLESTLFVHLGSLTFN